VGKKVHGQSTCGDDGNDLLTQLSEEYRRPTGPIDLCEYFTCDKILNRKLPRLMKLKEFYSFFNTGTVI